MFIIDIEQMYWEMRNTMKNNFQGTPLQKYKQAKKLFLENVGEAIDDNKKGLLNEMKQNE